MAILPGRPATPDTLYMTGSTTKAFTAAAVGRLVHSINKDALPLTWTTRIRDIIPADFALEDDYATAHTTIEDALSHRTGLPRHDLIMGQANDSVAALVRRMRYLPMTAEPRTTWQYCNLMYAVMTDVLETVHGRHLESILAEEFWSPLGMASTSFTNPCEADYTGAGDACSRLSRGYYWNTEACAHSDGPECTGEYLPEPYENVSTASGAGATYSSVNDYALWIKAFLDVLNTTNHANATSPLNHNLVEDLLTPRSIVPLLVAGEDPDVAFMHPAMYALGWISAQWNSETVVMHDGGITGFGADVFMLPALGYGVVTMANTEETSNEAGSIIAARLLRDRILREDGGAQASDASEAVLLRQLHELGRLSYGKTRRRYVQPSSAASQREAGIDLPLPGCLSDYAGQYSHPAYGTLNFSIIHHPVPSSSPSNALQAVVYSRFSPLKIVLQHRTDTVFEVQYYSPHGLGNVETGEGIVWQAEENDGECAVFEHGLDGEVRLVGIEIEWSMVEVARGKGPEAWREGLLWFDRLS